MIPPTSPGADSTAAPSLEERIAWAVSDAQTTALMLPAATGRESRELAQFALAAGRLARVATDAAAELEALRAALLRSQQERDTARAVADEMTRTVNTEMREWERRATAAEAERDALATALREIAEGAYPHYEGFCDPDECQCSEEHARRALLSPDRVPGERAQHASDCAVHSEPAYPAGPCNCGAVHTPEPKRGA